MPGKIIRAAGILLLLILMISLIWYCRQRLRDPLDFIDNPADRITVVQDSVLQAQLIPAPRVYHKLVLAGTGEDTVRCLISLPDPPEIHPVPVLIILGGLEIGVENFKFIPEPGNNAIVIYQYPYHPRYWYYGSALREIPVIRNSVLGVPAQIVSLYRWIGEQSWADTGRISLAGYSFGALFVPAILHLAQHHHESVPHAVIAYGGADLYQLLEHNMTNLDQPWRSIVAHTAITAIRGIDPVFHAPSLESAILLINGTRDTQIPESCWRLLHHLVPDPKDVILLEEGHMDPRKTELTMKLVRLTKDWLLEKGAVNQ